MHPVLAVLLLTASSALSVGAFGGTAASPAITNVRSAVVGGAADVAAAEASLSGPTFPPTVQHTVAIRLTNAQTEPTPAPFAQELNIRSSAYGAYEMPGLENVAFYNGTGAIIPSWLESGASSSANVSVYWINLSAGIPALSIVTVYLGFNNVSVMNNRTTGEAPELSVPYGQYDDGATVFLRYTGFEGTATPSIVGTLLALNGTGIAAAVHDGLTYSVANNSPSYGALTRFNVPSGAFVFDLGETAIAPGASGWGYNEWAGLVSNCCHYTVSTRGRIGGEGYWSGVSTSSPRPPSTGVFGFVSAGGTVETYTYSSAYSIAARQTGDVVHFGARSSGSSAFGGLFVAAGAGYQLTLTFSWARTRALPPNGFMPTASPSVTSLSWTNRTAGTQPSARFAAGMVYDASDRYVLLFGGEGSAGNLNDSWKFVNGNWTLLHPHQAPSPRHGMGMAYDPSLGVVVLFGGTPFNGSAGYDGLNDTWEYRAGRWTELFPTTVPTRRTGAALAYDPVSGDLVMSLGTSSLCCTNTELNDSWAFTPSANWVGLSNATLPTDRMNFGLTYDPSAHALLMFGGWHAPGAAYLCGDSLDGTWVDRNGTWSAGSTPGVLTPRQGVALAYGTGIGTVLYGGLDGAGGPVFPCGSAAAFYAQTWLHTDSGWEPVVDVSPPPSRAFAGFCYDARDGYLVLFGGYSSAGFLSDTWTIR